MLSKQTLWLSLFLTTTSFLSTAQTYIQTIDPSGLPLPGMKVSGCDGTILTDFNGIAFVPKCNTGFTATGLGLRSKEFSATRSTDTLIIKLDYADNQLNDVTVSAPPLDVRDTIEDLLDHSWDLYRESYDIPLPARIHLRLWFDEELHELRVDSAQVTYFHSKNWFPLLMMEGRSMNMTIGSNARQLERYVPPSTYGEMKYRQLIHSNYDHIEDLEDSQVDILSDDDSTRVYRIIGPDSQRPQQISFIRELKTCNCVVFSRTQIYSADSSLIPVHRSGDSLFYMAPFQHFTAHQYQWHDGKYTLLSAEFKRDDVIIDTISNERHHTRMDYTLKVEKEIRLEGLNLLDLNTQIMTFPFGDWRRDWIKHSQSKDLFDQVE